MRNTLFILFLLIGMSTTAQIQVSNTGAVAITTNTDTFYINGSFTNTASAVLTNDGNLYVKGNVTNNQATNLSGNGVIYLTGTSDQFISATSAFKNLTINKPSGDAVLAADATGGGVLNFVAGKIRTGVYSFILSPTGSLTGAAQNTGWVNGKLQKNFPAGAITRSFEIGDAGTFAPVSLAFTNITTAGNITASTIGTEHPNNATSIINPAKSVNRYWTITNAGAAFNSYAATFNFAPADIDAGAVTSNFAVGMYTGGWTMLSTSLRNPTNIRAGGYSTFGSYAIGESFTIVPVTFTSVKATRQSENILVDWKAENETGVLKYEVQRSANGVAFTDIHTTPANGSGAYRLVDQTPLPGTNFYRIRSVSGNGEQRFSEIANATIPAKPFAGIYPNLVSGETAGLQLTNVPKGQYTIHIYNTGGQLLKKQSLQHNGSIAKYDLYLNGLAAGRYEVILSGPDIKVITHLIKE